MTLTTHGNYRGWADRLAGHLAVAQGGLEYANLAIRGRTTGQIHDEQVGAALALRPDLVTVVAGMNDLLRPTFDSAAVAGQVEDMFRTFTGPESPSSASACPTPLRTCPCADKSSPACLPSTTNWPAPPSGTG